MGSTDFSVISPVTAKFYKIYKPHTEDLLADQPEWLREQYFLMLLQWREECRRGFDVVTTTTGSA